MAPKDDFFHFLKYTFNVSKFGRLYESKPDNFSVLSFRARDLAGQNFLIHIDKEHLKALPEKAYLSPLYAVEHGENQMLVIDGHHRIAQAMQKDPDLWMTVIFMPARLVPKICS
jgi:hypothetical protein